jgi:hypothetical protein
MKTILTEYEKNEHSRNFKDICFYTLYKDGYSYYLKFVLAPVRYDNGMVFVDCAKAMQPFKLVNGRQKTRAAVEKQLFDKKDELFELFKNAIREKKSQLNDGSFEKFISAVEKIVKQY